MVPNPQDEVTRSLNRLTTAIWFLALLTLLSIVLSLYTIFSRLAFPRHREVAAPETVDTVTPGAAIDDTGFQDWPLDRQIKASTVIVVVKWKKEGDRLVGVVAEILKQQPGVTFYYNVGDAISGQTFYMTPNTSYGDGAVIFFTGSPAVFRFSTTITGDRITGLGDMPLDALRAAIKRAD